MYVEATHVADRKATYLYVYVQSLYLYVNLIKCKRALPCLIILWDYITLRADAINPTQDLTASLL